jgi:hypothetical protein
MSEGSDWPQIVRIHLGPLVEKIRKIEVLKPDGRLGFHGQHPLARFLFAFKIMPMRQREGYSADKSSI